MVIKKKTILSYYNNVLNELQLELRDWFNYLRMNEHTNFELLNVVTHFTTRKNTKLKEAIFAHERLTVILGYFVTGSSYEDLKLLKYHKCRISFLTLDLWESLIFLNYSQKQSGVESILFLII